MINREERLSLNYDEFVYRHNLNTDKIKTLDDVKRILKFLNISATTSETVLPNGWEEVKDLFE